MRAKSSKKASYLFYEARLKHSIKIRGTRTEHRLVSAKLLPLSFQYNIGKPARSKLIMGKVQISVDHVPSIYF